MCYLLMGETVQSTDRKRKNVAHLQHYERRAELGNVIESDQLTDSQVILLLKELAPVTGVSEEEV